MRFLENNPIKPSARVDKTETKKTSMNIKLSARCINKSPLDVYSRITFKYISWQETTQEEIGEIMLPVTASTLNIPFSKNFELISISHNRFIESLFSEENVDVTSNPEAYSFQESLKNALISSSVAGDIGVPASLKIENFNGFDMEFRRSESTHHQNPVKSNS